MTVINRADEVGQSESGFGVLGLSYIRQDRITNKFFL